MKQIYIIHSLVNTQKGDIIQNIDSVCDSLHGAHIDMIMCIHNIMNTYFGSEWDINPDNKKSFETDDFNWMGIIRQGGYLVQSAFVTCTMREIDL